MASVLSVGLLGVLAIINPAIAQSLLGGPALEPVVAAGGGLLTALATVIQTRTLRARGAPLSLTELDQVAAVLAGMVRRQAELILEEIAHAGSLFEVSLRLSDGPSSKHWSPVDLEQLVSEFRSGSRRHLVITGDPGSGKTVAVHRMALQLLGKIANEPIPVVVPLAHWDSTRPLFSWMEDTLADSHPSLNRIALSELADAGRVVLILDGLDEIALGKRIDFLDSLNTFDFPFILTCRTAEYEAVAARTMTLSGAAVAELQPLTPRDVVDYLHVLVRQDINRWKPIFDAITSRPKSPLANALTSPLAFDLVQRAYAAPEAVPSELLDTIRFANTDSIERYLMETALVRAASGAIAVDSAPDVRPVRWLGFLAAHLARLDTVDLAWWRLGNGVPRTAFLLGAAVAGSVVGLCGGLVFASLWVGITVGTTAAVVTAVGLTRSATTAPFPARIQLTRRRSVIAIGLGIGTGTVAVVVAWAFGGALGPAIGWAAVGLPVGALAALRAAVTGWSGDGPARHPLDSLRRDRRMTYVQGTVTTVTLILAAGLTGAFQRGFVFVPVFGIAAGLVGASFSAYARYSVGRIWLALDGALPWRLMTFLETERRIGLLRQYGGVYMFRHRQLQDHLAAEFIARRSPVDEAAVRMVTLLREELVERAFVRTDVRAVIEAPSVAQLKKEIVTEIKDTAEGLVAATESARERFMAAKTLLLARAGVPRLALGACYLGYLGCTLAVAAAGTLFVVTFPAADTVMIPLSAFVVFVLVGLVHPLPWRFAVATVSGDDREGRDGDEGRSRVEELFMSFNRAGVAFLSPLHQLPAALFTSIMLATFTLAALTVRPIQSLLIPVESWRLATIVCLGALLLVVFWWWTRPLRMRWDALSFDDPERWPAEQDLPRRAASVRRAAVLAWEALVEALVDNGIVPMVAARVEVLAKRSYDTTLPDASVKRIGDLTESAQFVPTDTSAQLNRMLDAMPGGAIGLSGPRGIGKSTMLRIFGDRRFGGTPGDLTVVVPAPTNYQSRDFLVHLFSCVCYAMVPTDVGTAQMNQRWSRLRWGLMALVGLLLILGATLWPSVVVVWAWAWRNLRFIAMCAGGTLVLSSAVAAIRRSSWRRRAEASVSDVTRHHLRTLRYLETTTRTMTSAVKPPIVEAGGSHARQRAEQVKTYPELVGEFREFLAFLVPRLPARPDRRAPRIVVCIDEVDKIATSEAAEQFINDVKTVFGVPGCFFLVAVSEDALAAFSRRALTVRTAFDSAFDTMIHVSRLSLTQTRRLLVQRVLRLPEPYVWLCHALSGGLPRDLNRIVRQLYDIKADRNTNDLSALSLELIRQDLEGVTYGQILKVNGVSDEAAGGLRQWLAKTAHIALDHDSLIAHRDSAPRIESLDNTQAPELRVVRDRFQAYLYYAAVVLQSFRENFAEVIDRLSTMDDDAKNPVQHLADARTELPIDSALAAAAVDAYRSELA